jgi:hypothetical protein
MKRSLKSMTASLLATLMAGSLLLAGAAGCEEASEGDVAAAAELLEQVQSQDYRSFQRAPGWEEARQPGTIGHHGAFLDVYVNEILASAIAKGKTAPWPVGSIVIKDGWSDADGKELYQISILRKDGEKKWFGAEYPRGGKATEAGTNFAECRECHGKGADWILGF